MNDLMFIIGALLAADIVHDLTEWLVSKYANKVSSSS